MFSDTSMDVLILCTSTELVKKQIGTSFQVVFVTAYGKTVRSESRQKN